MVDAGKITLGVEINADGLSEKLAAEVRKQLAPVLAKVQKDLDKTNTGLKDLDTGGFVRVEKEAAKAATSTDKLATSTEKLKAAQDDYNSAIGLFGNKSDEAVAAQKRLIKAHENHTAAIIRNNSEASRSSRSQIDDHERVALAAERSARRQIDAAKQAADAAIREGERAARAAESGGGGGGGRPRVRRVGGGGNDRIDVPFAGSTSPATILGLGAAAVGALPAATTVVSDLAGALQTVAQSGLALPGVLAAGASSLLTAKLGFSNLGDAIDAVNKAAADGTPKAIKKATEALAGFGPEGQKLVGTIVGLQKTFDDLRKGVQEHMFAGLSGEIEDVVNTQLPTLKRGVDGIGDAWADTFKRLGEIGKSPFVTDLLDSILGDTKQFQLKLNDALEPLTHGLGTLFRGSADTGLPRIAEDINIVANKFNDWITKASGDGRLDTWINKGIDGLEHIGNSVLNITDAFSTLANAAPDDLLAGLQSLTGKLDDWLNSSAGQKALTDFIRTGSEQLHNLGETFASLGPEFQAGFSSAVDSVGTILETLHGVSTLIDGLNQSIPGFAQSFKAALDPISTVKEALALLDKLNAQKSEAEAAAAQKLQDAQIAAGFNPLTGAHTPNITDLLQPNNPQAPRPALGIQPQINLAPGVGPTPPSIPPGANIFGGAQGTGALPQVPGLPTAQLDTGQIIAAADAFGLVGKAITTTNQNVQAADQSVQTLAGDVAKIPDHDVKITADTSKAVEQIRAFIDSVEANIHINVPVTASTPSTPSTGWLHHATGGSIFGGMAGVDSVPALLMPGEHVFTTADVAAMGGQGNVYAFRRALHFDGGGEVPGLLMPGGGGDSVVGLLTQIRDLLAGKTTGSPLTTTADATSHMAKGTSAQGQQLGPFGTPIKPRDIGYEMAAAAISALGGDPQKFLGANPADFFTQGGPGATGVPGGLMPTRAAPDINGIVAALSGFATSGTLGPDLAGFGLDANASVIKAIAVARNKKKGGLDDSTISDLVTQVVGGGGFTGTLDATNTSLIESLQRFRDKLMRQSQTGTPPGFQGAVGGGGTVAQALQYAQSIAGSGYQLGGVGQGGVWDCSGLISDIYAIITGKPYQGSERYFTTTSNFPALGFVPGFDPNSALNIGVNQQHIAGTLGGIPIESGGPGGGGVTFGQGQGALQAQFGSNQFHLPIGFDSSTLGGLMPTAPGLAGPNLATSGSPVPVWIVGGGGPGAPGGVGGLLGQQVLGAGLNAAGQAAGGVASDVVGAVVSSNDQLPKRIVDAETLAKQSNPLAFAAMAGLSVPDFTRAGGGPDAQNIMQNAQKFNADGQMFSDTAALLDRTFTNQAAVTQAQHDQLMAVTNQIRDNLTKEVLQPVVQDAVQQGVSGISEAVQASIGGNLGSSAGPIIASETAAAVGSAVAANSSDSGGGGATAGIGGAIAGLAGIGSGATQLFAGGGPISGGVPGQDSVPLLAQQGEWMLNTDDVMRLGGVAGTARFVAALRHSGLRRFATGGGVNVNSTVGADFFGVSQIPLIGTIVNFLVEVLLKVIGVNIEARDTLDEISKDFKDFRGDFKAFDASGRLRNDTSGLVDRTSSSTQEAVDERLRILKEVLVGLVKYIIEKVIVPITKAVLNALISAGAGAAGGALDVVAPGAGGIVSSLISSAGSAGVDVLGNVIGAEASAGSQVAIGQTTDFLGTYFGNALTPLLGGGVEGIAGQGGIFSVLSNILGGIFGAGGSGLPAVAEGVTGALTGPSGLTGLLGGLLGGGDTGGGGLGGILGALFGGLTGGAGGAGPLGIFSGLLGLLPSVFGTLFGAGGLGDLFGSGPNGAASGITGLFTNLLNSLFGTLLGSDSGIAGTGGFFENLFGGALGSLFGSTTEPGSPVGGIFNGLFGGVLSGLFSGITSIFGAIFGGTSGGLGTIFGGLMSALGLASFDTGGMAYGKGFMFKDIIAPERMLGPGETGSLARIEAAMAGGGGLSRSTVIHAPISITGDANTGKTVQNHLLALMS